MLLLWLLLFHSSCVPGGSSNFYHFLSFLYQVRIHGVPWSAFDWTWTITKGHCCKMLTRTNKMEMGFDPGENIGPLALSTKDFCSPLHSICSCIAIIMPIDYLQNKKMPCPATDCQLIKQRNFHMEGGQFSSISGRKVFSWPWNELRIFYMSGMCFPSGLQLSSNDVVH